MTFPNLNCRVVRRNSVVVPPVVNHTQYPIYQRVGTRVTSFSFRLLYVASPEKLTLTVSSFHINCLMSSKTALNALLLLLHIHP